MFYDDDDQDASGFADPVGNFVLGLVVALLLVVLAAGTYIYPDLLMRRFM